MNVETLSEQIVSGIVSENPAFFAGIAFVLIVSIFLALVDLPYVFVRWIDRRHVHFYCALRHLYVYGEPCHYRCGLHSVCPYYKKRPSLLELLRKKKVKLMLHFYPGFL